MLEEKGLAPFINHLEFLGYESIKLDSAERDIYLCRHTKQIDFMIAPLSELDAIALRCQWSLENKNIVHKKDELFQFINDFNFSNILSCCHLDEDNAAIIRTVLPAGYSKIVFGTRFDIFVSNAKEFIGGIMKICDSATDSSEQDVEDPCMDFPPEEPTEDCCWDGCEIPYCDDYDYVNEDGERTNSPCYHNDDYS